MSLTFDHVTLGQRVLFGTGAAAAKPRRGSGPPRRPAHDGDGAAGQPCWVEGTVTDTNGTPVPGARIEVWEADEDGFYDVQYADARVAGRAHLFADEHGKYSFWGLTPTPYPIPHDGPVGKMLEAAGRSPVRASHLHFMVTSEDLRTLVTHIFVEGDPQIEIGDSDFGVKDSLIKRFETQPAGTPPPTAATSATRPGPVPALTSSSPPPKFEQ